jgi:hypothetical protein
MPPRSFGGDITRLNGTEYSTHWSKRKSDQNSARGKKDSI